MIEIKDNPIPQVCVLMATYNGSAYVEEQLNSIKSQVGVNIQVLVRDDGSSDNTVEIIEKKFPSITLMKGENIGCEASFLELLYNAPKADYYAFSDQDDVWMANKLQVACNALGNLHGPAMYGGNLIYCDRYLNKQGIVFSNEQINDIRIKFKRDFIGNVHGCTMVWNYELQKEILKHRMGRNYPHDTYVGSLANVIGTVVIDEKPYIYYRLHGDNVSGYSEGKMFVRFKKAIKIYLFESRTMCAEMAQEILDNYSDYIDKNSYGYYELQCLANYKKSIIAKYRLMNCKMMTDNKLYERFFWWICVLLERY